MLDGFLYQLVTICPLFFEIKSSRKFNWLNCSCSKVNFKFLLNVSNLISKTFNFIKCIPYFKNGRNLLSYFSPKFKEFDRDTSTGVYRIPCDDFSQCYIGETKRALTLKLREHQANCRNQKQHSALQYFFNNFFILSQWPLISLFDITEFNTSLYWFLLKLQFNNVPRKYKVSFLFCYSPRKMYSNIECFASSW